MQFVEKEVKDAKEGAEKRAEPLPAVKSEDNPEPPLLEQPQLSEERQDVV